MGLRGEIRRTGDSELTLLLYAGGRVDSGGITVLLTHQVPVVQHESDPRKQRFAVAAAETRVRLACNELGIRIKDE